jgi:hypothetical protein
LNATFATDVTAPVGALDLARPIALNLATRNPLADDVAAGPHFDTAAIGVSAGVLTAGAAARAASAEARAIDATRAPARRRTALHVVATEIAAVLAHAAAVAHVVAILIATSVVATQVALVTAAAFAALAFFTATALTPLSDEQQHDAGAESSHGSKGQYQSPTSLGELTREVNFVERRSATAKVPT